MKLKLGKLPSEVTTRLTIIVPEKLKGQLERYATLHSETWNQPVSATQIIPHILSKFLSVDRAFQRSERSFDRCAKSELGANDNLCSNPVESGD